MARPLHQPKSCPRPPPPPAGPMPCPKSHASPRPGQSPCPSAGEEWRWDQSSNELVQLLVRRLDNLIAGNRVEPAVGEGAARTVPVMLADIAEVDIGIDFASASCRPLEGTAEFCHRLCQAAASELVQRVCQAPEIVPLEVAASCRQSRPDLASKALHMLLPRLVASGWQVTEAGSPCWRLGCNLLSQPRLSDHISLNGLPMKSSPMCP